MNKGNIKAECYIKVIKISISLPINTQSSP